jgi:hypothetical protein
MKNKQESVVFGSTGFTGLLSVLSQHLPEKTDVVQKKYLVMGCRTYVRPSAALLRDYDASVLC